MQMLYTRYDNHYIACTWFDVIATHMLIISKIKFNIRHDDMIDIENLSHVYDMDLIMF